VGFRGIRPLNGLRVIGQVHYDLFSPLPQREIFGQGTRGLAAETPYLLGSFPGSTQCGWVAKGIRDEVVKTEPQPQRLCEPVPVPCCAPEAPQSARTPPESPTILFVGRLVPSKGSTHWLQVALACSDGSAGEVEIVGERTTQGVAGRSGARLGLTENVTFRARCPTLLFLMRTVRLPVSPHLCARRFRPRGPWRRTRSRCRCCKPDGWESGHRRARRTGFLHEGRRKSRALQKAS